MNRDNAGQAAGTIDAPPAAGHAEAGAPGHLEPEQFILVVLAWTRVTYVITAVLTITVRGDRAYFGVLEQWGLLVAASAWTICLFAAARRAGKFRRGWTWADVALAVALLVLVTRTCLPAERLSWGNWAFTFGLSSALIVGVTCGIAECAAAMTLLLGSFFFGLWPSIAAHQLQVTNLIGNPLEFLWFAGMAMLGSRYLRSTAARLDAAVAARIESESQSAALQALYVDRMTHYRLLHDTVLSTLTAIARGGLDHRLCEVRARCAREADYLRRLMHGNLGSGLTAVSGLEHALFEVTNEAAELGLRVHCFTDTLPELPAPVVTALGQAAREALNNVRLHAGVTEAWVTAVADGDAVTVTIVDRGRGFDQHQVAAGLGIHRSILGRLAEVNGAAAVISAPGRNTSVELRWPM